MKPFLIFVVSMLLVCCGGLPTVGEESSTSFESEDGGDFVELLTSVGIWNVVKGKVLVDVQHARTGQQCLQIAGGDGASVELSVSDNVKTDGQLSFWAERWTSRDPFSFRVEKKSSGQWTEIYIGDEDVRVGRAFLSHIQIPLGDEEITKLRFSVTSPANTGILIDDLRIAPAEPMKVESVEVIPSAIPALVGAEQSAIVKLKVTAKGILNPISIDQLTASLVGKTSAANIESIQPFFGGNNSSFRFDSPLGSARTPNQSNEYRFLANQPLVEGDNFIWLACKLKGSADIDNTIAAQFDSVSFSNGETKKVGGIPSVQRLGVAVRNAGDDRVHTYRIPGLATTNKGTLIGVYDVRHDRGGDLPGNIDVGMSRSTDGGRTWDSMKIIMDIGDEPKWRGDGIGDPSVLVDRKTGTIWVSATWSHGNRSWNGSGPGITPEETGQWMLTKSDDDGVTWSKLINITKQVKNPEWSFLLQGPGKGITMANGALVLPAQFQDPPNEKDSKANRLPHSTFIYSRDNGETWNVATGAWDDTTESQVVELDDGILMLNCRFNGASNRAILTTSDMGQTWHEHSTHVKTLVEPRACMASLINVGRELDWRGIQSEFNTEFLLFSNPNSLRGRNHMTIKASQDSGASWPAKFQLLLDEQASFGYSCLSMIDAGTVGILYEGSQAHMTFQRIKIADILSPPKNQKTKNPAFADAKFGFRPAVRELKSKQADQTTLLTLARPFTDHMVFQCEQPIRIWGRARPQSAVEVSLGTALKSKSIASSNGDWMVEFPSQEPSFESSRLTVTSSDERIELNDVLFGEVWMCAGQSNMEFELRRSASSKEALATAADEFLRFHNCPGGARGTNVVYDKSQMAKLWPEDFSQGKWKVSSGASAANCSAVGYFFAKQLRENLDRPVGIINVAVGGTPIESWVSKDRVLNHSTLSKMYNGNWLQNPILDEWCKGRAKSNLDRGLDGELEIPSDEFGPHHSFKPGFMYDAGIDTFTPLSIRGVLWYQGESNADNSGRAKIYDACFPLLIEDWRDGFRNPTMPVAFVQLPGMRRPNWPVFRELQRRSLGNFQKRRDGDHD